MDLLIVAGFAVLAAIVSALIAKFYKKPKMKILLFAAIGAIIGSPVGYFLAPVILSFY